MLNSFLLLNFIFALCNRAHWSVRLAQFSASNTISFNFSFMNISCIHSFRMVNVFDFLPVPEIIFLQPNYPKLPKCTSGQLYESFLFCMFGGTFRHFVRQANKYPKTLNMCVVVQISDSPPWNVCVTR